MADAKPNTNTTIIKLSETGTIINNTMVPLIADQAGVAAAECRRTTNSGNTRVHLSRPTPPVQQLHGSQSTQVADIRFVSRKIETKTVTVEVHRDTDDDVPCPSSDVSAAPMSSSVVASPPPPPPPPMLSQSSSLSVHADTDGGHSSLLSGPMSADAASLTSAISEELKKRAEVRHLCL